ncbi:16S rRNA (cytosine(967)-C(5))-methyltransferase RsmB [Virgibacillus necropolis]|uniref:16S rRNA (cytosine(967)-C(5))-methyltransferase n=1 Tax=Virgibacillus necropolis TaxID=163877 RepID=A0A221MDV3_9BACI|nr:16S rRNA (cytosine(967)-C(5))-methyltransferase RsmB [Virgibacillus necropolis]ASN05817.1 16S rRNA (cytosine(967)-C(5))-methyltransferase [Virgibacillus necropolis]
MNNSLREIILDLLLRIDGDSGFSHLLIDHEIKRNQVTERDAGLLTEIVYGTLQRKLTLDYYLKPYINSDKKMKPWVSMLLRMSVYQMAFLDKVPDHAIIHEAVEIAKQRGHKGIAALVNGVLRNIQRNGYPDTSTIDRPSTKISIETSHPEWLVERWIDMYGIDITKQMCEANLERKGTSVRIQPMKISREEAMRRLEELNFEVEESMFSSQGIVVNKGNILKTTLFKEGYVTVQDQSSMLVAEMLDPKSDMVVLDACSAPGGKVTHIAEKMNDQGKIHAYDLHAKKARSINDKAKTLNLTIIDAKQADARKLQDVHKDESFDRILVDAPCSGLGVIRGKPEIKYTKQESDIDNLAQIQFDILNEVAPLLKESGYLMYTTCTVDKVENNQVVNSFLESHPEYRIDQTFFDDLPSFLATGVGISDEGLQLFPHTHHTDGFFLTRFVKK